MKVTALIDLSPYNHAELMELIGDGILTITEATSSERAQSMFDDRLRSKTASHIEQTVETVLESTRMANSEDL